MEEYRKLQIEIIEVDGQDVIRTSGDSDLPWGEWEE